MERFSFETIQEFDSHISASIHGYDVLRQIIVNMASFFIVDDSAICDIGCTSGVLVKALRERYGRPTIGYDITDHNFIEGEDLRKADVASDDFALPRCQLVTSVFTLQFIPKKSRKELLKKIYGALSEGGTLIVCEKEYCDTGRMQEVFTFANYDNKKRVFSSDEILQKESDIRQIMHPQTHAENISMLNECGFMNVTQFFQSLNFVGYICQK